MAYEGNEVFENEKRRMLLIDGGYVDYSGHEPRYCLYTKDHLGSVRAVADTAGNVLSTYAYGPYGEDFAAESLTESNQGGGSHDFGQITTYQGEIPEAIQDMNISAYPGVESPYIPPTSGNSGRIDVGEASNIPYSAAASPNWQPYKFSGKESLTRVGLDLYDFGARMYSPSNMRWMTMDPLAEKYYHISPYVYCAGNPVNLVDPDGKEIWIYLNRGQENELALRYESGALFYANGDLYDGDDPFVRIVFTSLYIIDSIEDEEVSLVMSTLVSSPRKHIIEKNEENKDETGVVNKEMGKSLAHSGYPQAADIKVSLNTTTVDGVPNTPTTTLGHELMHAFDYDQGNYEGHDNEVDPIEIRAVYFENKIRKKRGLPIRTKYGKYKISNGDFKKVKICKHE